MQKEITALAPSSMKVCSLFPFQSMCVSSDQTLCRTMCRSRLLHLPNENTPSGLEDPFLLRCRLSSKCGSQSQVRVPSLSQQCCRTSYSHLKIGHAEYDEAGPSVVHRKVCSCSAFHFLPSSTFSHSYRLRLTDAFLFN
jgi:hypothetical protein